MIDADELRREQESLARLVKSAHEVFQSLRDERKQAKLLIDESLKKIEKILNDKVIAELDELQTATRRAMDESVEKVSNEFAKLEAVYLGTDPKSRKQGRKSIPELTEEHATGHH